MRIFAMMPMTALSQNHPISAASTTLPLKCLALRCETAGGLSRVVLEQTFANSSSQPLHVVYKLPLPADGVVSGFKFRIGEKTIVGEIDRKAAARERFEEAVLSGQTAALLEEERSSLFTQELGNVPPGAEITVEITIDQKLKWLAEGQWEWRFPLAAAPRYLGAPDRVTDAKQVSLAMTESSNVRASLALLVRDAVTGGRSPESPSHPLSCVVDGEGFRVELGSGNAVSPDRDVVVRWPVSAEKISVSCDVAGPRAGVNDAHALLTIVPPQAATRRKHLARDLTFLLDTSGSMGGEPINQAKKIVLAMLAGMDENDRFELIEFSNTPRRFRNSLSQATREDKAAAAAWVNSLRASGGTEMREGILEALRPSSERLRSSTSTHVVLITDGLIGFEQEIVASILALLPGGARLHTVGVGSSVNRSLTAPAARAGRGIEVVLGLGEDPDRAAHRLRAHSEAPIVIDVEASGDALLATAPIKIPDLFAGAPVLLSARVLARGGEIILKGKTADGAWIQKIRAPQSDANSGSDAVVTLFGRELVEDAEMRIAAGLDKRLLDASIEATGIAYKISTRLTSWVAIDPKVSVDPRDPSRRVEQPQLLPYGVTAEGVGLRSPQQMMAAPPSMAYSSGSVMSPKRARMSFGSAMPPPQSAPRPAPMAPRGTGGAPPAAQGRAAPPAEKGADERTLVGRIKDAFFKRTDAPVAASSEAAAARPTIKGRIVLKKSGEVAIEVTLVDAIDWATSSVSIVFADGGSSPATVDESLTTRSGLIPAGSTIRIALGFSPSFDASVIIALEIMLASGITTIEIES
ncbi:MAG: VIT domain-containing protein [Polyangiaceae bacterium]